MSEHTTPRKSFWTPANIVIAVILVIGLILTVKRFTMELDLYSLILSPRKFVYQSSSL